MNFRILFRLQGLEEVQLVQAQQAQFPEAGVVNVAFFQGELAANHLVARRRVAGELNPAHVELLAFIHVDLQRDRLVLFVNLRVRNVGLIDVAQRAVGLAQLIQALADQRAIEPVAVLDLEEPAQSGRVGNRLVAA